VGKSLAFEHALRHNAVAELVDRDHQVVFVPLEEAQIDLEVEVAHVHHVLHVLSVLFLVSGEGIHLLVVGEPELFIVGKLWLLLNRSLDQLGFLYLEGSLNKHGLLLWHGLLDDHLLL
jgi:hypothetical protein